MKEIILEIQRQFELALEAKNGWGKNEVKTIYQQVVIEVLAEQIGNSRIQPPRQPNIQQISPGNSSYDWRDGISRSIGNRDQTD